MDKLIKYRTWVFFSLCVLGFIFYYQYVFTTNHYPELSRIERNFSEKENQLDEYLKNVSSRLKKNKNLELSKDVESDFYLHIYDGDSLIYWNTNKLPVSKYADLHFPTAGITKVQNGWYYVKVLEQDSLTIAGSFLIKREYAFQNEHLKNDYAPPFKANFQSYISLDEVAGFPIYSKNRQYLFSIYVTDYQPASETESLVLMAFLLGSIMLFLWGISKIIQQSTNKWVWLFPIGIIGLRYLSLQFSWFSFMNNTELFRPSLYGTSSAFPNFFEYILNIFLILLISHFIYKRLLFLRTNHSKIVSVLLIVSLYLTWLGVIYLFKGLIENSSIPMHIEMLFRLNVYSALAILSIAILGFTFFIVSKSIVFYVKRQGIGFKRVLLINLILGFSYFFWDTFFLNQLIVAGVFPFLFISIVILHEYKEIKQKHLILGMLMLGMYSFVCAFTISEFNTRKEQSERELYISQLATERDISTELEYNAIENQLFQDKFLQLMISSGKQFNHRDFEEGMERRHFNGFWERYECSFYIFNENKESFSSMQGNVSEIYHELTELIQYKGEKSEINPSIFFIKDYTNQYSYIIQTELSGKNDERALLFVTLKSKKIPEEIGFPRLLISSKAATFQYLENYSVAKFHANKLISKYGSFNYPTTIKAFQKANPNNLKSFNNKGYNHLIYYKSKTDAVVLSAKNATLTDVLTSFSYLFCFFGLLLLPVYLRFYSNSYARKTLALSLKIQTALIGIVIISLVASGVGSGFFVKNQYSEYSFNAISEKTHSVERELKSKIGKLRFLSIEENGASLNFQLINLSKIFNTDINFYSPDGFLIATSRQKVFNFGLLSEQINPIAKMELSELDQSDFIHQENIGLLNYDSAYSPLYNNSGKLLGYLNLQHFGQQDEVESQIQRFLVAVINIFMLLLVISAIAAIIVANWITNPLLMLQERFSEMNLESNQPIVYNQDDEIGALVKSYNQKMEELEVAVHQLAQTERESAWRDMAKQVAHEIKNPLTPMKLSVQHLMRSFDPNDPSVQGKINKVSQSLIEQIDALTKIANEFSNFAKMPKPQIETIDLVQVIENSTELFKSGTSTTILTDLPESCLMKGDKEQLLRVFNNLIKNGLQAIAEKEFGVIQIVLKKTDTRSIVTISDNGVGMSDELKQRIFTPYFTTKSTGSGIGLAMVKQIILNHGGIITFESEENLGTSFVIELPIK